MASKSRRSATSDCHHVKLFVVQRRIRLEKRRLAVERSDFPVIKAVPVYVAIATLFVNLAADLVYKALDQRVKLQ